MNTKSFLQGLFYGLSYLESIQKSNEYIHNPQIIVWFKDGSHLTFAINRGISTMCGNFVAMLSQEDSTNLFDIANVWLTKAQSNTIEMLGHNLEEYGEIRVSFDQLVTIMESLGEIDYSITQKEWFKIYTNKYKKH